MQSSLSRIIFTLLCLCLSPLAQAERLVSPPAINIEKLDQQLLRAPVEFLVSDKDSDLASLPIEQFQPLTDKDSNRGISDQAFWLRLKLENPSPLPVDWVLHHETSYIDNIEIYWQDNQDAIDQQFLSDRAPYHQRPVDYRNLAFAHRTVAAGSTTLYLKLYFDKPDSVTLNFKLSEAEAFAAQQDREYLLYGLFYGAMLILILISFIGALLLRQWSYLLYSFFLLSSTLMWALLNGFAYQFLWPTSVFWHNEGFHIIYLLVAASAFVFSRQFLLTRLQFPRLDRVFKWLPVLMLAAIGLRFAGLYTSVLYIAMLSIVSLILLSVLGLMAYRAGLRYARWYAMAWVVYGCGLTLSVLAATTSLLPWGMESLFYAQAGAVIEAFMLLMALGDKLQHWEVDRQRVLKLVHQDALTGLSNRRVIQTAADALYSAFVHNGKPVFLALLDLDDFKNINDQHGHEKGDAVLKALANLMQKISRAEDVCIRQGGDEFMILFQASAADKALEKVDRIRQLLFDTHFDCESDEFRASLSAGISPLYCSESQLSEQTAFRQADQALYRAKQSGGNQSQLYQAELDQYRFSPVAPAEQNKPGSS